FIQSLVASNPAKIEVLINGVSLGAPVLAPATSCNWQQQTYTWNSGAATLAQICIYDREILSAGNDFALDDLSFTTTSTCTNKVSVTINVNNCGCSIISNASSSQSVCVGGDPAAFTVNTDVVGANTITYKYFTSQQTGNAMYAGGTVLGNVTPSGGTATYNAGILGTSGSLPNTAGTYYVYAILNPAPANPTCRPFQEIIVTVTANNTVTPASSTPTLCINTPLTNITHTTTGATGIGTATGLPAGITASWNAGTITISGTPTAAGPFTYTIPLTGGCGSVSATGTITVTANNTVTPASSTPTLCINTPLTNITHTTTGATGIGAATGLPAGVTASWNAGTITISGTPTAAGPFTYTIPLTGGCGTVSATGTITVTAANTVTAPSVVPVVCLNTPMQTITHTTTGATGIGTATGLPSGVTATWNAGVITISGTPSASGVFNYDVPLIGGCGTISATGTITVTLSATLTLTSGNDNQSVCGTSTAITPITYLLGAGATGVTPSGLPPGVTASVAGNTVTISGTPSTSTGSPFSYTLVTTGGTCGSATQTGSITVNLLPTIVLNTGNNNQTTCVNAAIGSISYTFGGSATTATVSGLPAGLTSSISGTTLTISGTPTTSAGSPFSYTVVTSGGSCGVVSETGTITVSPLPTVTPASGSTTQTVCANTAIGAITYTLGGGATGATVTGLPTGVNFVVNGSTVTISGIPTTTSGSPFSYTVTTIGGGCGTATQTGTITVNTNPTITLTSGNAAQSLCVTRAITPIVYTFSGGATGATVTGLPAGVTSSVSGTTLTISGTPTAASTVPFTYTVTTTGGGCGTANITGTLTVNPIPVVSAGPDRQVELGKTVVLNGTSSGSNNTILWTPPTGLSSTNTLTPVATITQTTTYTLTVTSAAGCTASDQVLVTLLRPIDVPNVFSPNGDGIHDRWVIRNIELYAESVVQIFNRYGSLIFERFGYNSSNAWDGTFNGKPMPVGAYYYMIRLSQDKQPVAGTISIIR
ncbi:MAG: gliding motility-associated C-terminal domain-containing protein, partial [Bacteroidota bacterium]